MYRYGMDQIPYSVTPISRQRMMEAKIYTRKFTDKSMAAPIFTDVHLTEIESQMSDFMTQNFPSLPFLGA